MKLSGNEWVQLVPFVVSTSVVVYLVVSALLPSKSPKNPDEDWVNKSVQKDKDKVADVIDIEDLGEKTAFCRCWKSKKVCFETLDKVSYSSIFLGRNGGPNSFERKTNPFIYFHRKWHPQLKHPIYFHCVFPFKY